MKQAVDERMVMGPKRFVGRKSEMDALVRALDSAVEGRRQVILISGEPGIGKTRITDELAAEAGTRGLAVYRATTWESGGAPALWPWIQTLRACLQQPSAKRALEATGPSAEVLEELVANVGRAGTAFASSPESRFLVFDAAAGFLQQLASETPTVLIFEDVHAADETTLQMLEFVANSTAVARLLLIATFRHVEVQDRPAIDAAIAALERIGARLHLQGLAPQESTELARETHEHLNDEVVATIARTAAGNPLFVTEIAKLARDEGTFSPEFITGPAGEGIRRAIKRRVESLSPEVTQILSVASVIGRDVHDEVLLTLVDAPEERAHRAVARAAMEGLVVMGPEEHHFTFAHELIKQGLYEGLSISTRRTLHQRIATLLEETHQRDPDRHADLIAHHYSRAAAEIRPRAIPYLREAGELAMSRFAYEGARDRFEAALALTDGSDLALRCDLMTLQGHAEIRGGSGNERETLLEAARLATEARDGDRLARALITLGEMKFLMAGVHDEEYISALKAALDNLPPRDERLRARLLAALAKELADVADKEWRQETLDEALSIARSLDDPETLAEVLVADLMRTQWELSDDTVSVCEALLSAGERLRNSPLPRLRSRGREVVLSAWRRRSAALLEDGDFQGFERDAASVLREVEGLPQPRLRWTCECLHATKAMIVGRFDEVEQRAENVLQVMPNELLSFAAWVVLRGAALLEQRRLHEMDEILDQLIPVVPGIVGMRCYSAIAKAQAGRLEDARSTMSPVFANPATVPEDSGWIAAMANVAAVARELQNEQAARKVYDALLPYRHKHAVVAMGQPAAYFGPIELHLGMAGATAGLRDAAIDHLERAIEEAERVGGTPWAARARAELARVLDDGIREEKERARQLAAAARTVAETLSLIELKEKVQPPLDDSATVGRSAVSIRREGEVWAIQRDEHTYSVKHTRGFDHLARLLDRPGVEIHALELASGGMPSTHGARAAAASEGLSTGGTETAVLDEQAKKAFRARLEDLRADIEEAEGNNDMERAARAREELDFLVAELETATGLGGRTRSFSDPAEKARVSVTKAIRRAIDTIGKHDQLLADYLERTVSTGLFCHFRPDTTHEAHANIEVHL